MIKILLQKSFKVLARRLVARRNPIVIAVTGTVGKTSTKEAIFSVLASAFNVRTSKKNFNNEWGVPFTILGIDAHGKNPLRWLWALAVSFKRVFCFCNTEYPEVLVLEFGIAYPGDMAYLTDIVKLDIAIITALGDVPVHTGNFPSREALWEEKLAIAKALKPGGALFYNADDAELASQIFGKQNLGGLASRVSKAAVHCVGFGASGAAHIRASGITMLRDDDDLPIGISFTVDGPDANFRISLPKLVGKHQLAAVMAAIAVGRALKVPEKRIEKSLFAFEPPAGRLKLLKGANGSFIFDDTYNASPASTRAALEVLRGCAPKRRIAVLGDMLELGEFTEQAHRDIGRLAAKSCDILFTVGNSANFIADEARKEGFRLDNIHEFGVSLEAAEPLHALLEKGDVVLVKGSQGMRMEKIVAKIMAQPERAGGLLARQDAVWRGRG